MHSIKYSIIIPHKNLSSDYLSKCINSIPKRDDLEIIVIDDNSDDSIVDFANFPGKNDNRIRFVFNKVGKGPGYSRNKGIEISKGEWLLFADADDYFDTNNLASLLDDDKKESYDTVLLNICRHYLDGTVKCRRKIEEIKSPSLLCDCPDAYYKVNDIEAWAKMVKRSLIEEYQIRFDEFTGSEDLLFALKIAKYSQNTGIFTKPIYHYVKRQGSLENSSNHLSYIKHKFNAGIRAQHYANANNLIYFKDVTNQYLAVIAKHSLISLWFYFIKEVLVVGKDYAVSDYEYACRAACIQKNPIVAIFAMLRVKVGKWKNKILKGK